MLLLEEADERPDRSLPGLAGGAMSTSMPTARLGSEGRDAGGEKDRYPPLEPSLMHDSGLEAEPEET